MEGILSVSGQLKVKKLACAKAPLSWRIRNWFRWSYFHGLVGTLLAKSFSRMFGVMTVTSELKLKHNKGGKLIYNEDGTARIAGGAWTDYGIVSRRVITNNGVAFIVDAMQNLVELENMNFHGCGTGVTAEAVGDSALVTESTTILNPDSTRATGTRNEPSANILRTVGVVTFDGSGAITEHGLFSQAATGGGVLFDRSVFSAVNVVSGESIQFEYSVTFTAGG